MRNNTLYYEILYFILTKKVNNIYIYIYVLNNAVYMVEWKMVSYI